MTLYPKLILDALATVRYPGTGKNLVEADMVADNIRIDGMSVSFSLTFEKPTDPFMKSMVKAAETAIHTYISPDVEVTISTESRQAARPEPGKMLPLVKNVIAVHSFQGLVICRDGVNAECKAGDVSGQTGLHSELSGNGKVARFLYHCKFFCVLDLDATCNQRYH